MVSSSIAYGRPVIIIAYIQLHSALQAFCDVLTFAIHTYLLELLESNRIVHGWLRRRRRPRSGSWFRWFSNCKNHDEYLNHFYLK